MTPALKKLPSCWTFPVGEVAKILELNERVTSVDLPIGRDGDNTIVETIADPSGTGPEESLEGLEISEELDVLLDQLNDKQAEVIARRFGLRGHDPQTLEDVGKAVGLTRERVRQIQVEALRKLRILMLREGLDSDVLFDEKE
jgi:DNA-directed RNA polymerase, sigma subunit (sigma70/sigma32)